MVPAVISRLSNLSRLIASISIALLPSLSAAQDASTGLTSALPCDAAIDTGRLTNGLRYYVRANHKPEKRAELRLAVNVGSVLEDENQRGLAHFTEHMAFNGTRDFRKQELVNYLESIGMRFGADVNAYTGFDETVYMLQVPTDSGGTLEKGIDILENWAHLVSFDDDEIDKERGVVIEEWRLGRGAEARMRDRQFPVIFKGSRYADRLPIGDEHLLETFPHEVLKRFYQDWYRPDLMAVVAVGDFDTAFVAQLIRKHFSTITRRATERPHPLYPVPDQPGTLYAIASDTEATLPRVAVYFKHAVEPEGSEREYRQKMVEALYNGMLNARLSELTQQADPPFLGAGSFDGRLVRSKETYYLGATVKVGGIERGLDAILSEARRVRAYGFTETELDRTKQEMLRGMQRAYEERDKTESSGYADECIRNFLVGEPSPGISYEYELYRKYLAGIPLAEVDRLAARWVTDDNRVVVVNSPKKAGVTIPTERELAGVIAAAAKKPITAYVDRVSSEPLLAVPPTPGTITASTTNSKIGITTWILSNGVRVVLKPTDFKNDEVLFSAFHPGGTSLAPDSLYISALMATSIVSESGVAAFDQIALQKKLAGKIVRVSPALTELDERLNGSASPKDLSTLFELIDLYCTSPRVDSTAYQSLRTRLDAIVDTRSARPESALDDTLQVTLADYHFRSRPFTHSVIDEIRLLPAIRFYRQRYSDMTGFTFIFVGSFTLDAIRPLVMTYLGGLPSGSGKETWRDVGMHYPDRVIDKTVRRGIEPKSQVRIVFSGPFDWSVDRVHELSSLAFILREKLREQIREEKGGTYGVGVGANPRRYPRPEYTFSIGFGCAPGRTEELTRAVFAEIDSLRNFGPDSSWIQKAKETQRRERETELKQNGSWIAWLQMLLTNGVDPDEILNFDRRVESLTRETVRETADRYLHKDRYVRIVLLPQETK